MYQPWAILRLQILSSRSGSFRAVRRKHTYQNAIKALNSLQSNYAIVDEIRRSGRSLNLAAIPEMLEWLQRAGYRQSDLTPLNIIHVAGTKGKGSTATFISSILNQYRRSGRIHKVGLYTSPHLRFVRERIQINGQMISEVAFAAAFFEMWQRFDAAAALEGKPTDASTKPVYFRFLTLMAFHIFLQERVDSAIIECGIGGEYDSTNVIPSPTVTAITSIGLDHVDMLGKTIPAIAWQKAGIMKPNAAAFTVSQLPEALEVLHNRAKERGVQLQVVPEHPALLEPNFKLGLEGSFQRTNASLAIAVAAEHLHRLGHADIQTDPLPAEFVRGLQEAHIGGRCETRREPHIAWHLDGAHTLESIRVASKWFAECVAADNHDGESEPQWPRILIFNQQTRDAAELLREVYWSLVADRNAHSWFSHVIFCSNKTFSGAGYSADLISMNTNSEAVDSLTVQKALADAWKALEGGGHRRNGAQVSVFGSIEEAITFAREAVGDAAQRMPADSEGQSHILITGSVHLIGGALEILETQGPAGV